MNRINRIYSEKFGATLVYHLLSQTLWSYWKPSTLYLKHMPMLMTCSFTCTCCLVLTLRVISLINAAVEHCISDICMWMLTDKLRLNDEKMEFMCNCTKQQHSKVIIGNVDVTPVSVARNLGTWFDFNLNLQEHFDKTCKYKFFHLYNMRVFKSIFCLRNLHAP